MSSSNATCEEPGDGEVQTYITALSILLLSSDAFVYGFLFFVNLVLWPIYFSRRSYEAMNCLSPCTFDYALMSGVTGVGCILSPYVLYLLFSIRKEPDPFHTKALV